MAAARLWWKKPKLMMGDVRGGSILLRAHAPGGFKVVNEGLENGLTALMAQMRATARPWPPASPA